MLLLVDQWSHARYYLESQEDMTVGACLREAGIRPEGIGPVVYDFKGFTSSIPAGALMVHPVQAKEMDSVHDFLSKEENCMLACSQTDFT